jgi:CBS domain-containing protein
MYSVKDILDEKGYDCWTIEPDTTVYDALKKMAGKDIGALMVVKNNRVIGVFSERDYARKIILKGKTSKDTTVGELVTEKVYYVKLTSTIEECMQLMTNQRIRHLPVLENDILIGMVSIGDIVNKIIQDHKNQIQQLEDYITGKR